MLSPNFLPCCWSPSVGWQSGMNASLLLSMSPCPPCRGEPHGTGLSRLASCPSRFLLACGRAKLQPSSGPGRSHGTSGNAGVSESSASPLVTSWEMEAQSRKDTDALLPYFN